MVWVHVFSAIYGGIRRVKRHHSGVVGNVLGKVSGNTFVWRFLLNNPTHPASPLPAQLPGHGRDRSSQSERAPQGCAVPRRALEPTHHADLRSPAAARDQEYCGEDFDLGRARDQVSLAHYYAAWLRPVPEWYSCDERNVNRKDKWGCWESAATCSLRKEFLLRIIARRTSRRFFPESERPRGKLLGEPAMILH